jgi:RNA polymerase sigma-70 factor, ECF subfamily
MEQDLRHLTSSQNREPQAWLAVYHELGGELFGYVYHLLRGNVSLTEEIVQSTWLTAIELFLQFDPNRGTLRNWIFAIARQRVVLHYRLKLNRPQETPNHDRLGELHVVDGSSLVTPPELVEQLERRDIVRAAMLCLPEDRRQVLLGKYVDGLTISELAASTSRTEKAVESLLSRAKAQLRGLLAHYFETPQKGIRHVDKSQSR